jgi:hypothetical protein
MAMSVDETLEKMIANWPGLYRSRLSTLYGLFEDAARWVHGQPCGLSALDMRDGDLDRPLDETLDKHDAKYSPNRSRLNQRLDYAKKQFVRANAALIARAEIGEWYDFRSVPSFSFYLVNRLPLDTMAPEWRKALIELCQEILRLTEEFARRNRHGYSADTINRQMAGLVSAKAAAQECLIRLGLGDEDAKKARQTLIQKLRFEAEALGLKLVEA